MTCERCAASDTAMYNAGCMQCYARALASGLLAHPDDESYYREAAEGLRIRWEDVERWRTWLAEQPTAELS